MHNTMALSLHSDALNAFKADFDDIMRQTISKMLENNETEGSVSAKITIVLENTMSDDGEKYIRPILKHDVKSVVQAKSSAQAPSWVTTRWNGNRSSASMFWSQALSGRCRCLKIEQRRPRRVPEQRALPRPHGGRRPCQHPKKGASGPNE